jgi:hypothetical protein
MSCINLENTQRMIQNFKVSERKVRIPLFQVKGIELKHRRDSKKWDSLSSIREGALSTPCTQQKHTPRTNEEPCASAVVVAVVTW